ncbi:MAG: polysaccharide export protein [Hungatella sp.]|nr:polysaccharide export protein [Hungatella sp.]
MEKKRNTSTYNDDEIDLLELFMVLKRKLWLILIMAFLGGGIAGAFSKFVLIPQYNSSAMLYILSKETTLTSLADLQIGSQLTKDYTVIVTSRPVLEEVISRLNLDITYKELREKITIDNPKDTRILTLTVQDPDPMLAKLIVDQVAATASDYIGDIMEMVPPKLIEDGEAAVYPVSPNNKKNALLGAVAGAGLICGLITIGFILNDTVQTEEDVEKYLNLTVLASVPERGGKSKKGKKDKKKGSEKEKSGGKSPGRSRKKQGKGEK